MCHTCYKIYIKEKENGEGVKVVKGIKDTVKTEIAPFEALIEKNGEKSVEIKTEYKGKITAPVKKGDKVGIARYYINGNLIGESSITAKENVKALGYSEIFIKLLRSWLLK